MNHLAEINDRFSRLAGDRADRMARFSLHCWTVKPPSRLSTRKRRVIQISFHDIYMVHRSTANTSDERRAALVMRIMPGTCYFDHRGPYGEEVGGGHEHEYTRRPLYLLRGQDRTGRNNFEIGHP
jgi:hypothetical protein